MTTTNTRLTPTIEFQILPESAVQHIQTQYRDTGKILDLQTEISNDLLTRTTVITFRDVSALSQYKLDTVLNDAFNSIRTYNAANGITHQRTVVNE